MDRRRAPRDATMGLVTRLGGTRGAVAGICRPWAPFEMWLATELTGDAASLAADARWAETDLRKDRAWVMPH